MKKIILLTILTVLLAVAVVNATTLEKGKIISKDIITNQGILNVLPSVINEEVNPGDIINQIIEIDLTTDLTKEFEVLFVSEGEIQEWISFEGENSIIKNGENSINFSISIPSNAEAKMYSGNIIMRNEGKDYNLVDISFEIIIQEVVTTNQGSNTGGGGILKCTYDTNYDWECSEWSECMEGVQSRLCNSENNCENTYGKPKLTKSCEGTIEGNGESSETQEEIQSNFFSSITGKVTDTFGPIGSWVVIIFLVGLPGSAITVKVIRKRRRKRLEI